MTVMHWRLASIHEARFYALATPDTQVMEKHALVSLIILSQDKLYKVGKIMLAKSKKLGISCFNTTNFRTPQLCLSGFSFFERGPCEKELHKRNLQQAYTRQMRVFHSKRWQEWNFDFTFTHANLSLPSVDATLAHANLSFPTVDDMFPHGANLSLPIVDDTLTHGANLSLPIDDDMFPHISLRLSCGGALKHTNTVIINSDVVVTKNADGEQKPHR